MNIRGFFLRGVEFRGEPRAGVLSGQPGGASRVCPALREGPGHSSGVVSITPLLSAEREGPETKAVLGSTSAALQRLQQLRLSAVCPGWAAGSTCRGRGESWLPEPPKPPFSSPNPHKSALQVIFLLFSPVSTPWGKKKKKN